MPLHPGQVLNKRYRIARLLGEGGFGAVYQAWDQQMDTPCAVKENLEMSEEALDRFEREAQMLYSVRHPNLAGVFDHFIVPNQGQYLVMDYVDGEDLETLLERKGQPLPELQVVLWISQICDALTYLHTLDTPIIHRDIKPANIKITARGRAVLVDFGVATMYDPDTKTATAVQAITPGYSAPEQGDQDANASSDIYSLGATTYTLLTNQTPPTGAASLRPVREINEKVSLRVSQAIFAAMQAQVKKRTPSAAVFKASLSGDDRVMDVRRELGEDLVRAEPAKAARTAAPRRRMSTTTLVGLMLLVGALLILGVLGGVVIINNNQAQQQRLLLGTNTAVALANRQSQQTNDAILAGEVAARETERLATATWQADQAIQALTATLSWLTTAQAATATQAPLSTQAAEQTADAVATLDWQATSSIGSQATTLAMEAHYQQAKRYIELGFWQEAWFELRDVIAGDPDYKDVQELLAQVEAQLALDVEVDTTLSYLWRKRNPLLSPTPRRSYGLAYDSRRGAAVLFGGYNGANLLGDTWLWTGDLWMQVHGEGPSARDAAVMVYDSERGALVLFGGRSAEGALGDTWQFKDNQWHLFEPPAAEENVMPLPRVEACAAYDRTRKEVVLFGGTGPDGFFADTWTFDGEAWTLHENQADGPGARVGCGMAYDRQSRVVVMYGGNSSGALGDTWEWDGTSWEQKSPQASPPARAYHAMLYHPSLNKVLVVGGNAGGCSLLKDTWAWDGARWVELDVGYPGTHAYINADYDSRRNAVMIFGGLSADLGVCQDSQATWELLLR
ncbi:protein kinase [Chloroflexota bacterium]